MKAALRTWLLADATLAAAISGVYSFPATQRASFQTKPYLMLSRLLEDPQELISGELGWDDESWQIDVLAKTDKAADAVKELVKARVYAMGGQVLSGYLVDSVANFEVTDGAELENLGGQKKVARKIIQFDIIRDEDTRS